MNEPRLIPARTLNAGILLLVLAFAVLLALALSARARQEAERARAEARALAAAEAHQCETFLLLREQGLSILTALEASGITRVELPPLRASEETRAACSAAGVKLDP